MTVFTVIVYIQNHTLTSKQSNKHILIVVKCLQLSTNNIGSATEIGADVKKRLGWGDISLLTLSFPINKINI